MAHGEVGKLAFRQRVVNAAAGDDERPLRSSKHCCGTVELAEIGSRTDGGVQTLLEELLGEVVGHRCDILGQAEERRPALTRIAHDADRLRQRAEHLRRIGDAVPEAHHGAEGVVDCHRGSTEVLDLLEDRVGQSRVEGVTGDEEHRQAIGHGHAGCRDHIGRAGADG